MLKKAILNNARGLALFAFFTAGIIAITQVITQERISDNRIAYESQLLVSLLPAELPEQAILQQRYELGGLEQLELLAGPEHLWRAFNERRQVAAIILPVRAPNGYTEAIDLLVAINPEGEVMGFAVTQHRETPGLGDLIETNRSDWYQQLLGQSLEQQPNWGLVRDGGEFDSLTGATITSRATLAAVANALKFYQQHQSLLLIP